MIALRGWNGAWVTPPPVPYAGGTPASVRPGGSAAARAVRLMDHRKGCHVSDNPPAPTVPQISARLLHHSPSSSVNPRPPDLRRRSAN